jgi:hypothetical protein
MFKAYVASGMLMLALFAYAQHETWSLFGPDDGSSSWSGSRGSSRSVFHK